MHFSFLLVVTALAACMSATACSPQFGTCAIDSDCCKTMKCNLKSVSMSSLLCIQDSTPLLTPNVNSLAAVANSAIIRMLSDGLAACP
ncbi:hypothetical protein F4604DRAFT_575466 [Suillus subluteus]|nr:hypothetical protein F4604DRAFT_575466 [Suillus subluteus]